MPPLPHQNPDRVTVEKECRVLGIKDGYVLPTSGFSLGSQSPSHDVYLHTTAATWIVPQTVRSFPELVVQANLRAQGEGVILRLYDSIGTPLLMAEMYAHDTWEINGIATSWPRTYANPFGADQVSTKSDAKVYRDHTLRMVQQRTTNSLDVLIDGIVVPGLQNITLSNQVHNQDIDRLVEVSQQDRYSTPKYCSICADRRG